MALLLRNGIFFNTTILWIFLFSVRYADFSEKMFFIPKRWKKLTEVNEKKPDPPQGNSTKWKGGKVHLFEWRLQVWTAAKETIILTIHEHESFNYLISLESTELAVDVRRELYACT